MYCSNCGTELREGTSFCPNCGQPVKRAQSDGAQQGSASESGPYHYGSQSQQTEGQESGPYHYGSSTGQTGGQESGPYQYGGQSQYNGGDSYGGDPYQYQQQPVRQEPDGFAIASLVLGIVSFFLLPIIGGILAIVFGNKSIRDNGMNTMARVGKILGIVALVLYIVIIVIAIAVGVAVGVGTLYYF